MKKILDFLLDWKRHQVLVLAICLAVLMVAGCSSTGEVTNARYYYDASRDGCEIPDWWLYNVDYYFDLKVLPWREYKEAAFDAGVPGARAFVSGNTAYLQEGHTKDDMYHEWVAHTWEISQGKENNHSAECWTRTKPIGYDSAVIATLPKL